MVWGGIIMTKRTFFRIQQRRINGQYYRCNMPYSIPTVQTKPGVKEAYARFIPLRPDCTPMISVVLRDIHKNYLIFQHFIGGSALSGKLSEKAK